MLVFFVLSPLRQVNALAKINGNNEIFQTSDFAKFKYQFQGKELNMQNRL